MPTARFITTAIAATFVSSTLFAQILATGDPRSVTEPVYPVVCAVVAAQFSSSQRSAPPSPDDTQRLEDTLSSCAGTGQSVILEPTASRDAFYSDALTVNGEALVVAAGVTLLGNNYGTSQMISVKGANAAIMRPGTIDGRGDLISATPRLINAKHITDFTVYNVTLVHSPRCTFTWRTDRT